MRPIWAEAEIVAEPVKTPDEPRVLVRRRQSGLISADADVDLCVFDGPPHISLFTGIGGFDLGLESAGYMTVCQHEWSEMPCLTLLGNRPRFFRHSALIQGDIRKTSTGMILREAGLRVGECKIVTGGPPCQGFSTANNKSGSGTYDERNDLVFEFLHKVNDIKPEFFIFENVRGFVGFNESAYVKEFLRRAHGCYYELVYGLMNCAEYMVPQDRCRFICIGTRRDLYECDGVLGSLPSPECFGKKDLKRLRILERFPNPAEEALLRHAPGVRYFPDRDFICNPDPFGKGDSQERAKNFIEFFRKLEQREPDRIVRAPINQKAA